MNKNNIEVIEVTSATCGGFCVGRLAGDKVAMVCGALPGERVRVRVTSGRSKVAYAQVVEVLTASPDQVEHIWPEGIAVSLGGAELGHAAYPAQLRWKHEVLAEALRRNGLEILAIEVSRVAPDQSATSLGASPGRSRISLAPDSAGFPAMSEAGTHRQHRTSSFPLLVANPEGLRLFDRKPAFAPGSRVKAVVPPVSVPVFAVSGEAFDADFVPTMSRMREVVRVGVWEYTYRIFASSFWQTDYRAPAVPVGELLAGVSDISDFEVLELHADSGLFSVFPAEAVGATRRLTVVEGDALAVKLAGYNLKHAGFVGVSVERVAVSARFLRGVGFGQRVSRDSLVVADPSRSGLGRDVAGAICGLELDLVTLISCDPVSYARDSEALRRGGYRLQSFQVFDLFPCTQRVRVLSVLGRQELPQLVAKR